MQKLNNLYNQAMGGYAQLKTEKAIYTTNIEKGTVTLKNVEEAREVIKKVALDTQRQLEIHISSIVTLALSSVFEDPYELSLKFVERRGKSEADISFIRNGEEIDPLQASGGGAVDVASFALRIALWSLKPNKTRNTIILDEPFRYLSKDLQVKAGEMVKMLSDKLDLQIIMVTHNPDLIEASDKVFTVTNKKGLSYVTEG